MRFKKKDCKKYIFLNACNFLNIKDIFEKPLRLFV